MVFIAKGFELLLRVRLVFAPIQFDSQLSWLLKSRLRGAKLRQHLAWGEAPAGPQDPLPQASRHV
jgi:hypothetical protein